MLRRAFLTGMMAAPLASAAARAAELLPVPDMDRKGFFIQKWLRPTTADLRRDLALASAEGKALAIFWEMAPCPYCTLLHADALRDPTLNDYVARRFYSVRFDKFSDEPLTDFNGAQRTQRDASLAHRVLGTPTLEFRIADGREVARLPGYAPKEILLASFQYVEEGGYLHGGLTAWLRRRGVL